MPGSAFIQEAGRRQRKRAKLGSGTQSSGVNPCLCKGSKQKEPEELSQIIPSCGDFAFSAMNLFAFPGPGNRSCAPPALLRAATGAAPA